MYSRVTCPELWWKIKDSQLKGLTFLNWISIASGGLVVSNFYIVHVHLESQFNQNFFFWDETVFVHVESLAIWHYKKVNHAQWSLDVISYYAVSWVINKI